jgi:hypothetical protein
MTATVRGGHGAGSIYRDAVNGTRVGAITIYRHELRPVISAGADVMGKMLI